MLTQTQNAPNIKKAVPRCGCNAEVPNKKSTKLSRQHLPFPPDIAR
jgi:hypothetical protein